ncbi:MAG TPA: hypothetical protein VGQ57_04725 [Polyangiaceae bacterium]|jgi:hypothetical protein|nr:hypothetical protein [Polyangiaceae bacterium]
MARPALSRRGFALLGAGAVLFGGGSAWGGTYLNRAAVLLAGATREAAYLRARIADRELAGVVHRLAQARVAAAGAMTVPKEVAQAHPHLLLVLENYEQASDAATRGEADRFTMLFQRAQDEERTFRAVIKSLGWLVPDSP